MSNKRINFTTNEIRPDNVVKGQKKAIAKDIEWLKKRKKFFVRVACPACNLKKSRNKFKKNGFQYEECLKCQSFYMSPRPTEKIIEEFLIISENYKYWNTHIFPASQKARRKNIVVPRVEKTIELCDAFKIKKNALLEIGVGDGSFCEELSKQKVFKQIVGVEPSPSWAENSRKKGIDIIEATIEKSFGLDSRKFDVAINFEVIEHLYSPPKFIKACHRVLKPGGLFIVTCPNGKGFDIDVLGQLSDTVDHEHLNYFNPESLSLLLKKNGFKILETLTPGRLDADLVRQKVIDGSFDLSAQPFLKRVLIDEWDRFGTYFQDFLVEQKLSSNMWIVARKSR